MRRVLVGLAAFATVSSFVGATRAEALSCGGPSSGDVVVVGTVVSVSNRWDGMPDEQGTWARVAVEEVWRNWPPNEAVGDRVEIRGGPKLEPSVGGGTVFASAGPDHRFELGQRYLINAHHGEPQTNGSRGYWNVSPSVLVVRPCVEAPLPWNDELASSRPRDAVVIPQASPIETEPWPSSESSPPYVLIGLTTVLVAGGSLYLLFRRGSIAYRAREDADSSSKA